MLVNPTNPRLAQDIIKASRHGTCRHIRLAVDLSGYTKYWTSSCRPCRDQRARLKWPTDIAERHLIFNVPLFNSGRPVWIPCCENMSVAIFWPFLLLLYTYTRNLHHCCLCFLSVTSVEEKDLGRHCNVASFAEPCTKEWAGKKPEKITDNLVRNCEIHICPVHVHVVMPHSQNLWKSQW